MDNYYNPKEEDVNELKLFGMRMKELRIVKNLSQELLANKAGISPKYMSRIEMGLHFPSFDIIVKLANALQVEVKDFFEFAHEAKNVKDLKEIIRDLLNEADVERLRLAVKVLRALMRWEWGFLVDSYLVCSQKVVFLVSPNFLASDFIDKHELNPLLKAAEENSDVSEYLFTWRAGLIEYQAAYDISKHLDSLSPTKQNVVLVDVSKKIKSVLDL